MTLEVNENCFDETPTFSLPGGQSISFTPPIGEGYWLFRVRLGSKGQAIIAFPKFSTIGISFAQEEDWNTNLPYTESAAHIFAHIQHNKGDESIADSDCLEAIEAIRSAAKQWMEIVKLRA